MVVHEAFERVEHVTLADVPGVGAATQQRTVIRLRAGECQRVLFGVEGAFASVVVESRRLLAEFAEHGHRFVEKRCGDTGGMGVVLKVFL